MRWRTICLLAVAAFLAGAGCRDGSTRSSTTTTASSPKDATLRTPSSALQRIVLRDGSVVTVEADDHVVITGADGRPESESWCGSYSRAVAFLGSLQDSLRRGDRDAVAERVLYPLRWNRSSPGVSIGDRTQLIEQYEEVFTPTVVDRITQLDARAVFCNSQGFMIGQGVVWGNVDNGGRYGLTTLNA